MWKARSLAPPRTHLRFAAGCLLAVATLVPLSGVTSGFDSWPRFAETISLHRETSLSNYVGLLTVAGYDANNLPPVDLSIRESRRWEARRAATLRERSWLVAATWLLYAALVVRAARRAPDWVIAALGAGGVFMFLEITAYYYPVLIAFALLHERDDLTGPALAAFSAISLLLSSVWADSGLDFVHAATSAALMPLVLVLTWRAGQPGEPCPDP